MKKVRDKEERTTETESVELVGQRRKKRWKRGYAFR